MVATNQSDKIYDLEFLDGDFIYVGSDIKAKSLEEAKRVADLHVCGLLSDDVCFRWNGNCVMNYDERIAILNSLDCVDKVMKQSSINPIENQPKNQMRSAALIRGSRHLV